MGSKRKNSGEASGLIVVVVAMESIAHTDQMQRGMMAGAGLRLQARREILQQVAPQYHTADVERKSEPLEALVQITGYHHKYAMWLLNHTTTEGSFSMSCCSLNFGLSFKRTVRKQFSNRFL
ncbi:MAG: hypothetical protein JO215_14080 [Ktedonobacteraceae bacterium]|nr:hypothetical protein [Ktedonobacteraceae bacterium]